MCVKDVGKQGEEMQKVAVLVLLFFSFFVQSPGTSLTGFHSTLSQEVVRIKHAFMCVIFKRSC